MSLGLLGRKVGMTRIFTDDGETVPVTVVDVSDNRVTQLKSVHSDGYSAVQLAFGQKKPSRVPKPLAGHFAKAGVQAGSLLGEFPLSDDQVSGMSLGQVVSAEIFSPGQKVDVTGTTQGKGFAGTIARHNFSSQRASHGNSRSHNVPGSIGMAQDPGRVFPGKKMPGHDGDARRTVQNLEVARVDVARQLLLIKGAIPGSKGGHVVIRPAVRQAAVAAK
ncbi:MAG: 50S ribosomal protein L3 [Betaproteobacteria bacterium]|jgi:large subunit ribosomal protein L3|nr:50S ribosomal protein L3 [Betaproteobacteria bacterium]